MTTVGSEPVAANSLDGSEDVRGTPKGVYRRPNLTIYGSVKALTQGTGSANGDTGQIMMDSNKSDPRLKENIVRIGTHPAGFGIYLYDYRAEFRESCGEGRQFGVMADEVERIVPSAVSRDEHGYRVVDYAQLGVVRH